MKLDPRQEIIADDAADDLMIVAGPGGGKTAVLAARISGLIWTGRTPGHQIVALTYTRSMAVDLAARVSSALPEEISCSECGGWGVVDHEGREAGCGECGGRGTIAPSPPVCGTLHSLAAAVTRLALRGHVAGGDAVRALGWVGSHTFGIALPEDVEDLVDAAYHAARKKVRKRDLIAGLQVRAPGREGWPPETAARQELARRGLLTYDDVLTCMAEVAQAESEPGAPSLRELWPCVLVDEAQDLSPLHWSILDRWAPRALTAAGDDGQEIFGFLARRLAAEAGVAGFSERLCAAESVCHLTRNYRSAPEIVAFASALRGALAAEGACVPATLEPMRGPGGSARVVVAGAEDEGGVRCSADAVEGLLGGRAPGDVALIGRTWAEVEAVAGLLVERGIPVAVPERGRDRWRALSGRGLIALARHADRGLLDELDARTLLRLLGHADPARLSASALSAALATGATLAEALDAKIESSTGLPAGWWASAREAEALSDLQKIAAEAEHRAGPALCAAAGAAVAALGETATPGELLLWLASDESGTRAELSRAHVCATTFHGAKGLEWPAVVVIGACEGSLPAKWDKTPEAVRESARALYVGVTRARDALAVVAPSLLRGKPRNPSPWLVASGLATLNPSAVAGDQSEQTA